MNPVVEAVDTVGTVDAQAPIGIFDSGVGGLTVARAVMDQLPHESMIYIGDTAHAPYGPQPLADVRAHAQRISDELVERGCKMLVIACNTATAAFLHDARERYNVPVVEVIQPAVRRAMATTRNGKVGVIGTQATITSGVYQDLFALNPSVEVTAAACPAFVEFVERGITSGRQILGVAQGYLEPLQAAGVDTLVLGCTHYPLLSGVIQLAIGDGVTLVSSAEETSKDVLRVLTEQDMLAEAGMGEGRATAPTRVFESTGDPEKFDHLAERILGPRIHAVQR
ncbi:glutamate racemase [Corynebacterium sp. HMSC29G08]|uniref:glutamate racemase n=1 Tax=Corynebacterium sp. HMSC29G08 TaxID=1581069 RepID=UPI000A3E0A2A|nr:glutamate racemase [Corynebacterium sp. HMSC29G08]